MFLAQLYVTGSVTAAARAVGLTRASAYRLRGRADAESFAHAWDTVLTPPGTGRCDPLRSDFRKVTNSALIRQAETGLIQPVLYRGSMTTIRRKADNSALFRLLRRLDAATEPSRSEGTER